VVRKLSFTGSTEVGRLLMAQCAPTIKKLSLELGRQRTVHRFRRRGRRGGGRRGDHRQVPQHRPDLRLRQPAFWFRTASMTAFVEQAGQARAVAAVGPGSEEGVTQGPLIDEAALAKVEAHIADAVRKGARVSPAAVVTCVAALSSSRRCLPT
jgi:succinate-semialdehyde dehydrogenase/glutarate-semialdehyde dehydrogenase